MKATEYLEQLQRQFTQMVRTPLARVTRPVEMQVERYPAELCTRVRDAGVEPSQRLATYNRQYWTRLFTQLQTAHHLTAGLLGAAAFNELATRFLLDDPPTTHELTELADSFAAFIARTCLATALPPGVLEEAQAIDAAVQHAARTAVDPAIQLTARDSPRLPAIRLALVRSARLVEETRPLLELSEQLPEAPSAAPSALPDAYEAGPRTWLLWRGPAGIHKRALGAEHAALVRLLADHAIGDAVAALAVEVSDARRWVLEGLAHGIWNEAA
jgi:hypothetical protein